MDTRKETTDLRYRQTDEPSPRYRGIARVQRARDWLWKKYRQARARGDEREEREIREQMRACRMKVDGDD